jgi:hypothetical protein
MYIMPSGWGRDKEKQRGMPWLKYKLIEFDVARK